MAIKKLLGYGILLGVLLGILSVVCKRLFNFDFKLYSTGIFCGGLIFLLYKYKSVEQ